MSTIATTVDDILYILDDPGPPRAAPVRHRAVVWIAAASALALLIWPAYWCVAQACRQLWLSRCAGNLKRIGVAMHEYHEAHDRFPSPAIMGPDGTKLLSWRVAILPFIGQKSLYERFHLDEPWDSPHNLSLLAEMPPEFACPAGWGPRAGKTGYLVIVGPEMDEYSVNTVFEPRRGAPLHHITDGTANSIMLLETDALVPWTKPDDLSWARGRPLPRVASPHPSGAHALFADGSARFIKDTIATATFSAILTINGGEVIGGG